MADNIVKGISDFPRRLGLLYPITTEREGFLSPTTVPPSHPTFDMIKSRFVASIIFPLSLCATAAWRHLARRALSRLPEYSWAQGSHVIGRHLGVTLLLYKAYLVWRRTFISLALSFFF